MCSFSRGGSLLLIFQCLPCQRSCYEIQKVCLHFTMTIFYSKSNIKTVYKQKLHSLITYFKILKDYCRTQPKKGRSKLNHLNKSVPYISMVLGKLKPNEHWASTDLALYYLVCSHTLEICEITFQWSVHLKKKKICNVTIAIN